MESKDLNLYFFFTILICVTVFVYFIFKPFLTSIFVAAALAILFQNPHKKFLKFTGDREHLSSLLTSLLIILLIIIPVALTTGLIFNEISFFLKNVSIQNSNYQQYIEKIQLFIRNIPFLRSFKIDEQLFQQKEIIEIFKGLSQWALVIIQKTYMSIAYFVLWVFVMFFSLFFFLKDGKEIIKKCIYLSPLQESYDTLLLGKFSSIIRATVKGSLVIALFQGIAGGIIFAIAGVRSPVVWAMVMMVFSLVPLVGTSIIWVSAGIIMLILGNIWQGLFILAGGAGFISLIDNILRPRLVGKDTQMHPLLVFFSTLGGIATFGFAGILIGPIIVALFLTLWEIYARELKSLPISKIEKT